ncbi:MAG: formyl transferase [Bacteroidales bacterium]|jgi:methionyl-tRNA formyltransferase|nr:formyl transferase [Bacteroidales bacterium]
MIINILGKKGEAYKAASDLVIALGHCIATNGLSHVAIAPLLTQKITLQEINYPLLGTLIFHPSPLPYGRGASAIRWAYRRREPVTAATWLWANENLDAGDICEQEIVKIDYELRPREFYEQHVIPAMLRTLDRALNDIEKGVKRQIKQVEEYATYDCRIE